MHLTASLEIPPFVVLRHTALTHSTPNPRKCCDASIQFRHDPFYLSPQEDPAPYATTVLLSGSGRHPLPPGSGSDQSGSGRSGSDHSGPVKRSGSDFGCGPAGSSGSGGSQYRGQWWGLVPKVGREVDTCRLHSTVRRTGLREVLITVTVAVHMSVQSLDVGQSIQSTNFVPSVVFFK